MNDNERELWVRNDEGLYAMWQASKLAMRKFLRTHRTEIDNYIKQKLAWNKNQSNVSVSIRKQLKSNVSYLTNAVW